jgi:hypothetical protein
LHRAQGEALPCRVRDGRVEIPPLEAGDYRLDLFGERFVRTTVSMELRAGVPFERDVTLVPGVARRVTVALRAGEESSALVFATFDATGRELGQWPQLWFAHWGATSMAFRSDAVLLRVAHEDGRRIEVSLTTGGEVRIDLR